MMDGLKLAITGEELILGLNERIERYRSTIQFKRDQISGKVEPPKELYWEVPAGTVEPDQRAGVLGSPGDWHCEDEAKTPAGSWLEIAIYYS